MSFALVQCSVFQYEKTKFQHFTSHGNSQHPPSNNEVSCPSHQVVSTHRQEGQHPDFIQDYYTKTIILARGVTQWQVAGSCSARDLHVAGPDLVTHYCAAGPSSGCGGDAAVLDFGSECFSACAGRGLDCDYRWKGTTEDKPTSSGL